LVLVALVALGAAALVRDGHEDTERAVVIRRASYALHLARQRALPAATTGSATAAPRAAPAQAMVAASEWKEGQAVRIQDKLKRNEALFSALRERGVPSESLHAPIAAANECFNFRHSRPGDDWLVEVDERGQLTRLRYQSSPERVFETTRQYSGAYACRKVELELDIRRETLRGAVQTTLWASLEAHELPGLSTSFVELFASHVDFAVESQPGDTYAVVYEKIFLQGNFLRSGRILAASYTTRQGTTRAFLAAEHGQSDYFDAQGRSLKRPLLRGPLSMVKVSAPLAPRQVMSQGKKPAFEALEYVLHQPQAVVSVGAGVVVTARGMGSKGYQVVIRYEDGYSASYSGLGVLEKGMRVGKQVARGEVIGRAGMQAGVSLRFELTRQGKALNPYEVALPHGELIAQDDREAFLTKTVRPLAAMLDSLEAIVPP
jgi:murein DD-endopeptidase MepM/ murein hydrolase activator NlpD